MHGRTRSKSNRPRMQIIIEYFFVQGEKDRSGGWKERFLASSESKENLVLLGSEMCRDSNPLGSVI